MKQIVIIWLAIALMIGCLLYPPYGYTRYTTKTIYKGVVAEAGAKECTDHEHTVWTYVANAYIFSQHQPNSDPRLFERHDQIEDITTSVDDMGIGWHIVAIECLVIVLVAAGLLFTVNRFSS